MSIEFFRLIEARSPEEIAEEMKYAFGPSKGKMSVVMMSGSPLFDERISDEVLNAMECMFDEASKRIGLPKEYANEKENTSALDVL